LGNAVKVTWMGAVTAVDAEMSMRGILEPGPHVDSVEALRS